jgi:hypothetical protein
MRRSVSEKVAVAAVLSIVVLIGTVGVLAVRPALRCALTAVASVQSQVVRDALAQSDDDTTGVEDSRANAEKEKRDRAVSISIDESGIRIETPSGVDEADTTKDRIIVGTRFKDAKRGSDTESDIVRFGEDINIDSNELVRGDVVAFFGDADVAGRVLGDVVVIMGDAKVRSGAEVVGDMVVIGGVLDEEPEAVIHGERVVHDRFDFSLAGFPTGLGRIFEFFFIPVKFFVSLILSFLVVLFMRDRVVRSHEHVAGGVLKSFGTGFLVAFIGIFVVVFLTIILFITLIGIPLALILLVSCVAIFIVADTVFVYTLGSKVSEKLNIHAANSLVIVFVGMAALYLPAFIGYGLSLMPFGGFLGGLFKVFGWLLGVFAFLAGLGALFLSRFGARGAPGVTPMVGTALPPQV